MNVALVSTINDLYVDYFKIMLNSLLTNNKNFNLDYIVLYDGVILDEDIKNIKKIYNNIKFIKIKNELKEYDNLVERRVNQWVGKKYSIFSRFEIFNFEEYDKLIYLDVDIIVDKNIDYLINNCNKLECYAVKLSHQEIFNAGVMVINKKNSFIEYKNRCINIIKNQKKFSGNQSIFNECFKNSIEYIPIIYNLDVMYADTETILKENRHVILHYPGNKKPWDIDTQFSNYYLNAPEFNRKQFVNIWNNYKKIYTENIKNYEII